MESIGCLWRTLLFLIGMILFTLLFSLLLRGCDDDTNKPDEHTNPLERLIRDIIGLPDDDPYRDLPEELRDNSPVTGWGEGIPGVDELPAPEDNYIPPVDTSRIVPHPEDSLVQIVADQLIVFFNARTDLQQEMTTFAKRFKELYPGAGYSVLYYNPQAGTMLLGVPQEKLEEVLENLPRQITDIDFRITTNEILAESDKPSDPGFGTAKYDEYFKLIQAYEAWDITRGSSDVKVAIVDSYFDLSNPEIGERYVDRIHIPTKTVNVMPPAAAPNKDNITSYSHGSHVAGIAIGTRDNRLGCSGIAPECTWIPISLGDQLTTFNIMEGILYAVYHGADVVNFSLGRAFSKEAQKIPLEDQVEIATTTDKRGEALWEYIIKTANDHNCVLCTSAGNETILMGLDPKNRGTEIIKVEAVDNKGQKANFSNFGCIPEAGLHYSTIAAPGVDIWSSTHSRCAELWKREKYTVSPDGLLQEMSGTSMAAPVVTGAVALLKSKNKNLTTQQVIKILTMTAKQTDTQHRIGPTLQIKDALDATGGDLLNFDDLMNDHDLLIGKWRSTHETNLVKESNEEKIDEMWTYFIFTSTTEGRLEYHTINSRKVFTAPLTVKWGTDRITITQHSDAVNTEDKSDRVNKDTFVCHPNSDRLLEASVQRNGVERFTFQLEKVN
ncbi:MAG: S8 family serine peptidase [Coprobacter sp.]|nr:S8 family serine peptidase [Coprobacter sp.]